MSHRKYALVALVVVATLVLAGCSKLPQAELDAARAAMDSATTADAATYAPEALGLAQETMRQVDAEIAAQETKLFKSYEKTAELIAQAETQAEAAQQAAVAGKEQARQEATAALEAARKALTAAEAALAVMPASKDAKADLEAMTADLQVLRGILAEAESAFQVEDYATARQSAEEVRSEAESMTADLSSAGQTTT